MHGVIENVFALCFGGVAGGGALVLGAVTLPPGLELRYTPLLGSERTPHYYMVKLEAISVDAVALEVSQVCMVMGG